MENVSGNRNWERGWFVRDNTVNNAACARSQVTSWVSSIYGNNIRWLVRIFQSFKRDLNVDK